MAAVVTCADEPCTVNTQLTEAKGSCCSLTEKVLSSVTVASYRLLAVVRASSQSSADNSPVLL